MVKRITLFRIICFWLLAACAASCQSEPASGGRLRGLQSRNIANNSARNIASNNIAPNIERPRQESGPRRLTPEAPLPDAPMPSTLEPAQFQSENFRLPGTQSRLPFDVNAANTSVLRQTQMADVAPVRPPATNLFYGAPNRASAEKSSGLFWDKYLYPSALPQNSRYQESGRDGLVARAADAASKIFITHDLSGTRRLNTSYFLRVATLIAADTASRPYYRRRSGTAPLSDFGSTIGDDAGMNLLHEFGPSLHQAVSSHMPKFISRIEQSILQSQSSRAGILRTR